MWRSQRNACAESVRFWADCEWRFGASGEVAPPRFAGVAYPFSLAVDDNGLGCLCGP